MGILQRSAKSSIYAQSTTSSVCPGIVEPVIFLVEFVIRIFMTSLLQCIRQY